MVRCNFCLLNSYQYRPRQGVIQKLFIVRIAQDSKSATVLSKRGERGNFDKLLGCLPEPRPSATTNNDKKPAKVAVKGGTENRTVEDTAGGQWSVHISHSKMSPEDAFKYCRELGMDLPELWFDRFN